MKTLGRLSFQMMEPAEVGSQRDFVEQRPEFETIYEQQLSPILHAYGLHSVPRGGGSEGKGVISWMLEAETPSRLFEKWEKLQEDTSWQKAVRDCEEKFGSNSPEGRIEHHFSIYQAPAGEGKVVTAEPKIGHWHAYEPTDGLADGIVQAIAQDQEGYLWFGTLHGGLSRYDGQTFTNFSISDGLAGYDVRCILLDQQGYLWSGGFNNGVSRYDGRSFTSFTTRDGLASNHITSLLEDREGHLWVCSEDGGISCYDGRSFTSFTTRDGLASNHITSLLEDREGHLWVGTRGGGISRYDGRSFTSFTTRDGLAGNHITSLLEDRQGHLWVSTEDAGIGCYDGRSFTSFTTRDGLTSNQIMLMLEDREGRLWAGARNGGISCYSGQTFEPFTTKDGLASSGVRTMLEDREGHLWIGSIGGVNRYDGRSFTSFTNRDGLTEHTVFSLLQDQQGNLWFACRQGGITCYDGRIFTSFSTQDGLPSDHVRRIFQDRDGHLWIGTQGGGISCYDGQSFRTFTTADGLGSNNLEAIFQDRDGHLWFGTDDGGISRYDGQVFTTFTTENGLANNWVTSIFQDREGYIWFGGRYIGVSRYDGQSFTIFTTRDGLAGDGVMSIFQDSAGHMWFGTSGGGVSRYDGQTFSTLTTKDGLAGNVVWSIIQDSAGHLWFGTNGGGVSRYDGQTFSTLTTADGLAGNVVWSILQDQEGDFWFATNHGVTRYHPLPPSPPLVFIDALVADRRYEGAAEVSLTTSVGSLAFEFRGMSFKTRPGALSYRYRLKNYEVDWSCTNEQKVEYRNIPKGAYVFEVVAIDRDLVYTPQSATQRLKVIADPRLEALTEALSEWGKSREFIGKSEVLLQVQSQITEVAQTDLTVMILGETGTGKGLAALAMHALSRQKTGPFIQVNCGAIPEGLVESELFGHERGAFTGANARKLGKAELATGGTLFLDEIGDLALEAQVKILRLLEDLTFERVGGTESLKAEVRIIAATNRDLVQMVNEGKFRSDLYFRLQTFPIHLPPLRERREDIPLIAAYYISNMSDHLKKEVKGLHPEAMAALQAYDWPGNVRELENVIKRAVIICQESVLRLEDMALGAGKELDISEQNLIPPSEYEKRYIQKILERAGGVIRKAADIWGVPESTLRSRMKKLGIRIKKSGIVQ